MKWKTSHSLKLFRLVKVGGKCFQHLHAIKENFKFVQLKFKLRGEVLVLREDCYQQHKDLGYCEHCSNIVMSLKLLRHTKMSDSLCYEPQTECF